MGWDDVIARTALDQAALIRSRDLSSEELVRAYLDRIDALNPTLNAFVTVFRRRALLAARRKDLATRLRRPLPMFHGVPIGIKDMNFVRWSRTRMGSKGMLPIISPIDDQTAGSVRRAGFVILGKTSMSEAGAMPSNEPDIHPPGRNPWNTDHTPGGSSGGAAAAVAARMLPIAQGSDGGGSIRGPASFCHLFGIKPSRGRVRNPFGVDDREAIYTSGPIARGVEDAAALLDVLACLDIQQPHWAPAPVRSYLEACRIPPGPLKVRFTTAPAIGQTDPEIAAGVVKAARALEQLGHHVDEGKMPECTLQEFLPIWQQLMADNPFIRRSRTQPITQWLIDAGKSLTPGMAIERQRTLSMRFLDTFHQADLWLTPTTPIAAPEIGAFASQPPAEAFSAAARIAAFTAPFNVTGQPASNVPMGLNKAGLPMGLQVVGRLFADDVVLKVSRQLEQVMPWADQVAPLAAAGSSVR